MTTIPTPQPVMVLGPPRHDVEANTTTFDFEIHFPSREEVNSMTAEKPPVRITKQRAQAFLDAADRGIDEKVADLKKKYGLVLTRDGNVTHDDENYGLLEAGAEDRAAQELDEIKRAIDTLAIFRRRYG